MFRYLRCLCAWVGEEDLLSPGHFGIASALPGNDKRPRFLGERGVVGDGV